MLRLSASPSFLAPRLPVASSRKIFEVPARLKEIFSSGSFSNLPLREVSLLTSFLFFFFFWGVCFCFFCLLPPLRSDRRIVKGYCPPPDHPRFSDFFFFFFLSSLVCGRFPHWTVVFPRRRLLPPPLDPVQRRYLPSPLVSAPWAWSPSSPLLGLALLFFLNFPFPPNLRYFQGLNKLPIRPIQHFYLSLGMPPVPP